MGKNYVESSISSEELDFIENYKRDSKKSLKKGTILYGLIYTVLSFVPLNLIPRTSTQKLDTSSSLVEYLGFFPWLAIFLSIGILFYLLLLVDRGVNKDIRERVKIRRKGIIKNSMAEGKKRWFSIDGKKPNSFNYESKTGRIYYDYKAIEFEYYKNSGIIIKVFE